MVLRLVLVWSMVLFANIGIAQAWRQSDILMQIRQDYRAFYQGSTLIALAPNLMVGGLLANSQADVWLQDKWQQEARYHSQRGDNLNDIGDLTRTLPALPFYMSVMAIDHFTQTTPSILGQWANYSLRSFLVGAPAGLATAHITGAGRPTEGGSQWRFLADNNSVSGHSFSGAIPFINAAMLSEPVAAKALFYGLSVLPAVARVELNAHYVSQAVLGWSFAYMSAKIVQKNSMVPRFALAFDGDRTTLHYRRVF